MKCGYCGQESVGKFCSPEHEENSRVSCILENITDELDLVYKPNTYPWKVSLTGMSYDILKNRPGTHWVTEFNAYQPRKLVYELDGHEYLVCWENHNIPFVVHARIADTAAAADEMELDDLVWPNVKRAYLADLA